MERKVRRTGQMKMKSRGNLEKEESGEKWREEEEAREEKKRAKGGVVGRKKK